MVSLFRDLGPTPGTPCFLGGTRAVDWAGPTMARYPPAVAWSAGNQPAASRPEIRTGWAALASRDHSWYTAFLKKFVLAQGTYTPQVVRHAKRTNTMHAEPPISRVFKSDHSGGQVIVNVT